jgi:hypothetical protein
MSNALDEFTSAYIACALWSSHDESDESGGEPMDANYSIDDFAPETITLILTDCIDFQHGNASLLERAKEFKPGYTDSSAGHDFWLTRNGHGAGFWDRGLRGIGTALTQAAKVYGSSDLYVGDDGKIYVQ